MDSFFHLKNPLVLLCYFLIRRGEITSDVKLLPLVVETWQKKLKNKKAHHFICCLERQRCWKSNWRGRMMPSLCWGSIPTHKYNSIAWHFGKLSVNKMHQYCINKYPGHPFLTSLQRGNLFVPTTLRKVWFPICKKYRALRAGFSKGYEGDDYLFRTVITTSKIQFTQ